MELEGDDETISDKSPEQDLLEASRIFDDLMKNLCISIDLSSSEVLSRVAHQLTEERNSLSD